MDTDEQTTESEARRGWEPEYVDDVSGFYGPGYIIRGPDGPICVFPASDVEGEPVATLIAAAPDLRDELSRLVRLIEVWAKDGCAFGVTDEYGKVLVDKNGSRIEPVDSILEGAKDTLSKTGSA